MMNSLKLSTRQTLGLALVIALVMVGLIACSNIATTDEAASTATASTTQPVVKKNKTLDNLQAAFNGERNARSRYLAFADKADKEGYGKVASLFRAAARAEDVHASNHAEVIRKLGATPVADIKVPEVKSTAENIEAAIQGESYERDTMYPEFLKQARLDRNNEAVRTFNFAKEAEAVHASLYTEAKNNLAAWKTEKQDFYVCPSCGYTTLDPNTEKCPVDFTPREKFLVIS